MAAAEQLIYNLVGVVDFAHGDNGVGAVVRAHNQGLGLIIRDAANAQATLHAGHIFVKLRPERRVFNVVNGPVKALFPVIHSHARPAGAQVRVIVCPEEQVEHAVLFRGYSKKSAHMIPP